MNASVTRSCTPCAPPDVSDLTESSPIDIVSITFYKGDQPQYVWERWKDTDGKSHEQWLRITDALAYVEGPKYNIHGTPNCFD